MRFDYDEEILLFYHKIIRNSKDPFENLSPATFLDLIISERWMMLNVLNLWN
jgi:hypothetical protein